MYPFSREAKKYADQDVRAPDVEEALAFLRNPLAEETFYNPAKHVMLYALAKAILSCCSQSTKNKYAEQKTREYVKRMTEAENLEAAREFFPAIEKQDGKYVLPLGEYLSYGSSLVHQSVENGKVTIEQDELNALMRSAIKEKFLNAAIQDVPEEIRKAAAQLEPPSTAIQSRAKFLNLACMQYIAKGVDEGKRFYGAFGLSISAKRDGLPKEKAVSFLTEYVQRCRGTKAFTAEEAKGILDWVYSRDIGFSCSQTMDNGFEGEYCQKCPLNWKRRKS
ncbi:hypothetical protein HZC09_01450 [Candidatus Micrarchaeota archaeon]|nr:hypothetical protein [Candidatus Micrarchaeota archaeon]